MPEKWAAVPRPRVGAEIVTLGGEIAVVVKVAAAASELAPPGFAAVRRRW